MSDETEWLDVGPGWWGRLDRSDWPEIISPDFGGVDLNGNLLMIPVCPGCGLYDGNDDDPSDHFMEGERDCQWALDVLRRACFDPEAHRGIRVVSDA